LSVLLKNSEEQFSKEHPCPQKPRTTQQQHNTTTKQHSNNNNQEKTQHSSNNNHEKKNIATTTIKKKHNTATTTIKKKTRWTIKYSSVIGRLHSFHILIGFLPFKRLYSFDNLRKIETFNDLK
jgi:hypothetical protein